MSLGVECFLGTFEMAVARAEALGLSGIAGPFNSAEECEAYCLSQTGTTTTPPPACGHCAAGQMQQTYYTQIPGAVNNACGKCDQLDVPMALTLHEASGNCAYRTSTAVLSCGASGPGYLELRYSPAVGTWFIYTVYPSLGSEEAIYRCADGNFNCAGASTFEHIGGIACQTWPTTIQVWV